MHASHGSVGVNVGRSHLVPGSMRAAAAVLAGEAVVAVGGAAYFLMRWVLGAPGVDVPVLLGCVALFLLAAWGLVLLARGIMAGSAWPRTPAVLWHLLVAPVGWSLWEAAHPLIGGLVLAAAAVGIWGVLVGVRWS